MTIFLGDGISTIRKDDLRSNQQLSVSFTKVLNVIQLTPRKCKQKLSGTSRFSRSVLLGETGTGKTRAAKPTLTKGDHQAAVG